MELQELMQIDRDLLLFLNGSHSLFFDGFFSIYTSTFTWLPVGLLLLYVIAKNNSWKNCLLILASIALLIVLTDQISSGITKPYFQRWRPTRDPELMYLVNVVNDYRGGRYGFISGHATNSFGLVVFLCMLIRSRALSLSMILWATLHVSSRIYLGVHYPGDILAGTLAGVACGFLVYGLMCLVQKKYGLCTSHGWISANYTRTGYLTADVQLLLFMLFLTLAVVPIVGIYYVRFAMM